MMDDWKKFTSMGGGLQDVFIGENIDFKDTKNPIVVLDACLGTYSGGGSPRWTKKMPEFKTPSAKRVAKEKEKEKIEKRLLKLRQKYDLIVHNEMRRLGYTKVEG